jgi:HEAT repeat protein
MISKKLNRLLMASTDAVLLEYARDEIGAGVGRVKYSGTLEDLRVRCLIRKNTLARLKPPPPKGVAALSTAELAKLASTERGPRLEGVLRELGKRDGKEALAGLAVAAASYEGDTQKLARQLLDGNLSRQSRSSLRERFDDDVPEVRKSAIRVAAGKHPALVPQIIDRLTDDDADVRAEARQVLKTISKGEDFGPQAGATKEQQRQAQRAWKAWWDQASR